MYMYSTYIYRTSKWECVDHVYLHCIVWTSLPSPVHNLTLLSNEPVTTLHRQWAEGQRKYWVTKTHKNMMAKYSTPTKSQQLNHLLCIRWIQTDYEMFGTYVHCKYMYKFQLRSITETGVNYRWHITVPLHSPCMYMCTHTHVTIACLPYTEPAVTTSTYSAAILGNANSLWWIEGYSTRGAPQNTDTFYMEYRENALFLLAPKSL